MIQANHLLRRCLVITVFVSLAIVSTGMAQESGSSRATPSKPRQPTVREFAASFWRFIHRSEAPYEGWKSVETEVPEGITDEHHGSGKVYLDSIAAKDQKTLPKGAVLVRPEYSADGKKLQFVNVMYRTKANDQKDWYFLRYLPNGALDNTAASEGSHPIAGHVASCIECHQKAERGNLVFFNNAIADEKKPN
jgi:hypothetical protein